MCLYRWKWQSIYIQNLELLKKNSVNSVRANSIYLLDAGPTEVRDEHHVLIKTSLASMSDKA